MVMMEGRRTERAELQFVLENRRPVDVTDLGLSLQALGTEYEEFVVQHGYEILPINARLYISRVETGSIVVTLQTLLDQASFLLDYIDVFGGFVTNLNDIIEFLLKQDKATKPPTISTGSVERIAAIIEPIAKDSGSNLIINIVGNTAPVTVNPVIISSEKANAIQNGARRFLSATLPTHGSFEKELLYLDQMKGDPNAKTGDRGIIEKFSKKPVKLQFMNPAVKAAIVDQTENPFKMAYVVDGEISTVNGIPGLYKIHNVHEAIEKP